MHFVFTYFYNASLETILAYVSLLALTDISVQKSPLHIHTKWERQKYLWNVFGIVIPVFWIVCQTYRPAIEHLELFVALCIVIFYALLRERLWLNSKEGRLILLTKNGPDSDETS